MVARNSTVVRIEKRDGDRLSRLMATRREQRAYETSARDEMPQTEIVLPHGKMLEQSQEHVQLEGTTGNESYWTTVSIDVGAPDSKVGAEPNFASSTETG